MARKVKCGICKTELSKEDAYCVETVSEKTKKISRKYYCSEQEYKRDKYLKSLHREIQLLYDYVLGYTCISKQKVLFIKELEENYTREQVYECLKANADKIKNNYLDKEYMSEYQSIAYITACVKGMIKDFVDSVNQLDISVSYEPMDCLEETDEDIFNRLKRDRSKKESGILDIIREYNRKK